MNDDIRIASVLVAVGSKHWKTPWDYIEEVGYFPTPTVEGGRITGSCDVGQNRGVHLAIPVIPELPEGYTFIPGLSRIGVIHRQARMIWQGGQKALADFLETVAGTTWDTKAEAEAKAMLTYQDATSLLRTISLDDYSFLAYRVHHLVWHAAQVKAHGRMVKRLGLEFKPGVCGHAPMAERPFVEYVRDGSQPSSDNEQVTVVHITEDHNLWNDPTGRTHYA